MKVYIERELDIIVDEIYRTPARTWGHPDTWEPADAGLEWHFMENGKEGDKSTLTESEISRIEDDIWAEYDGGEF